jgi:hypothetical protein
VEREREKDRKGRVGGVEWREKVRRMKKQQK